MKSFFNDFDTCVYDKKNDTYASGHAVASHTKKTPEAGFIYIFIVIMQILEYFLKYRGAFEVRHRI